MEALRRSQFLRKLLSLPTVPFHEHSVRRIIKQELEAVKIPYFEDSSKNLIAGISSPQELRQHLSRPRQKNIGLFIAHMDHPGFHLTKALGKGRYQFKWFGGGPVRKLVGAEVYVSDRQGTQHQAVISKVKLHASKKWLLSGDLVLRDKKHSIPKSKIKECFGSYRFANGPSIQGSLLKCQAADDLAGIFAFVEALKKTFRKSKEILPIGLLTVGEEIGWVGALAHFEEFKEWQKPQCQVFVLSLEASREFPRAELGRGPVVRLGDKASIFDPTLTQSLLELSCRVTKRKFQWRMMDGGVCEGTVTQAYNLPTVALCVPLRNYHNSKSYGPLASRGIPAPEMIDLNDLRGMQKICEAVMLKGLSREPKKVFRYKKRMLLKSLKENRIYLRQSLR